MTTLRLLVSVLGMTIFSVFTAAIEAQDLSFLTNGLVAYYPLDANANDLSGNNRNGEIHGATFTADRFGQPERAANFEFVGDHIRVPNSLHPNGEVTVTYALWMTWPSSDWSRYPAQTFVNIGSLSDDGRYISNTRSGLILLHASWTDNGRTGVKYVGESNDVIFDWPTGIAPKTWRHVVITKEGNRVRFYFDGVFLQELGTESGQDVTSSDLFIGWNGSSGHGSGEQFFGGLDDIRIYSRAISDAEVQRLYRYESNVGIPKLTILQNADQTLSLSWRGAGALQQTESLTPPNWQPAPSQTNPQTISTTDVMKFYRVKAD